MRTTDMTPNPWLPAAAALLQARPELAAVGISVAVELEVVAC